MQNGVNIDDSIDRCEFCEFFLSFSNNILSGMIILKNDVIAILSEKVNSISARNGQSTFPVGPDKQYEVVKSAVADNTLWDYNFSIEEHISKASTLDKNCLSNNKKSFLWKRLEKGFQAKSLQFISVSSLPF